MPSAYVLQQLLQLNPTNTAHKFVIDQLERLSARITTNRVIAGVHFPLDSMAGRMLGVALGEYFVARCTGGKTFMNRKFLAAGADLNPTTDFNPFNTTIAPIQALSQGPFYYENVGGPVPLSNLMGYFWTRAHKDWKGRFGVP